MKDMVVVVDPGADFNGVQGFRVAFAVDLGCDRGGGGDRLTVVSFAGGVGIGVGVCVRAGVGVVVGVVAGVGLGVAVGATIAAAAAAAVADAAISVAAAGAADDEDGDLTIDALADSCDPD